MISVHRFALEYEFTSDEVNHVPSDDERVMIADAINGYLATLPPKSHDPTLNGQIYNAIGAIQVQLKDGEKRREMFLTDDSIAQILRRLKEADLAIVPKKQQRVAA